ncbi:DoxX family protein [Aeromicrobium chenweiae]|uniref:DoxX family protein n=1 Tax=Aeromicrobium chenweiae TaxID=2079793 RepID=A0A2S0WQD4_9ACTN|nr:DoxX family protein [Aeromicrobium chenweiae]AWB93468.1 DoxX family protein [Aeromicrobium chenweiae]TGN34461.1 DoxX family protein [Aeromicrobium chenweiae]
MTDTLDLGLLALRVMLALLLLGHATQKLFGWFRGMGVAGTGTHFESLGFSPGPPMVVMAGVSETVAATLLALGLLTPLGGAVAIGTMIVAASANFSHGLWAHLGGYEVAFVYAGTAAVLVLTGPGEISLDHALGWTYAPWVRWVALVVGVVAAVPLLVRRSAQLRGTDRRMGPDAGG